MFFMWFKKINKMKITKKYLKNLVYKVNGAAIEVHKNLGPGLLESVYHKCLKKELSLRNIDFQSELVVVVNGTDAIVTGDLVMAGSQAAGVLGIPDDATGDEGMVYIGYAMRGSGQDAESLLIFLTIE